MCFIEADSILARRSDRNSQGQGDGTLADVETLVQLLVEVQTQLAYQEDTMQALNDALASQQQEILVLRRQVQLLKQRLDEQGSAGPASDPGTEKPPHY